MSKSTLHIISSCSTQKTASKNTKHSRNETILKIAHHAKGYRLCKILTLGQKLKFQKTCQNPFYKSFLVVLCKTPLQKNAKYSRNETILKICHQNPHFGSKIKIQKNISKFFLQIILSCSVQKKRLQKNTKYWGNETILKIDHRVKAIAFAKSLLNFSQKKPIFKVVLFL